MRDWSRRELVTLTGKQLFIIGNILSSLARAASHLGTTHESQLISWQRFVDLVNVAARSTRLGWNQAEYVSIVSDLARRLNLNDPVCQWMTRNPPVHAPGPAFHPVHTTSLFQMSLISFEAGESIPLHDHPAMTGVSLCMSGSLRMNQFDVIDTVGPFQHAAALTVKPYPPARLISGTIEHLTEKTGNLHSFRADHASTMLDIFTPPYDAGRLRDTHWYSVEKHRPTAGVVKVVVEATGQGGATPTVVKHSL